MTFGGGGFFDRFGGVDLSTADAIVGRCIDAGVNLFDTANIYAWGQSEETLGTVLKSRRDQVIIATKGYNRIGDGPNDVGTSRQYLVRAVEGSLRRLGTDRIDLYQLHLFDSMTPIEETLRTLDDLVHQGKVRYTGVCNYSGYHLMKALAVSDRLGLERCVSHQVSYSLLNRDIEGELVLLAVEEQVGMLIWGPMAGGLLTGKFNRHDPAPHGTRHDNQPPLAQEEREHLYAVIDVMEAIAQGRGVTVAQVALNWVLAKFGVSSAIVGARTTEQIDDSLSTLTWRLDIDEVAELDAISARPWAYPYNVYKTFAGERNPYYRAGEPLERLDMSSPGDPTGQPPG